MTRRLQIVVSSRPPEAGEAIRRPGFWQRFKLVFAGVALAIVGLSVLVAALVFGSILAAVLWILLVVAVAAAILRTAFRQANR